jgi:predicted enzyme related to lactoylglutathione lyase
MANNLASFAIHCDDVARARAFYEKVFGWRFEPWGPPDFYLIHTGDDAEPGIQGLLQKRQHPRKGEGLNGFECTISVDDLDAIVASVEPAGGKMTMPKFHIPTVGTLVRFLDTEGNDVGAMKYDARPQQR